jgi:hypothetical protein
VVNYLHVKSMAFHLRRGKLHFNIDFIAFHDISPFLRGGTGAYSML